MSDLDFGIIYIFRFFRGLELDQNLIDMNRTDLLIAMTGGFIGCRDDAAGFQLLDMAGQGTVCDV